MADRLDAWIWAVRLVKTRSAATAMVRAGHVRLNGERAKAAAAVKPGDEVRLRTGDVARIVVVRQVLAKRVGAPQAAAAYDDLTPPPPPPEERVLTATRDRGAGRPTKRDRRLIDRLTDPFARD
jgi:Ribosome-associated heat shock protein implicated in the recycling of the 50S subunit (S4 paralog)